MPVPAGLSVAPGRFMISPDFRLSIYGSFNKRIYAEASRFIRRMGERTGYFYDRQGYVSAADSFKNDPLVIEIKRAGRLKTGEAEGYSIEVNSKQVKVFAETDLGAIHALESAGRAWHTAYTSSSLAGIQAAVAAGMGLSILSEMSIQSDHRVLTAKEGFAPINKTEVALMAAPDASPATLRLADRLAEFCDAVQAKAA